MQLLEEILARDPASKLARYGLAVEFANAGEWARAMQEFETMIDSDPSYAAAYYHGGQTLEKMGDPDRAREFYRRGLAANIDAHTRSEIQAALDILGD